MTLLALTDDEFVTFVLYDEAIDNNSPDRSQFMTTNNEKQPAVLYTYQAYLIRIWQDGRQAAWRASAQAVHCGEVVRFASLDALFAYLKARTTPDSDGRTHHE